MDHVLRCHEMNRIDIVGARGCILRDVAGREYIDFEAGVWCANLGHSHPRIVDTIRDQSGRLLHIGYRCAHRLVERAAVDVLEALEWTDGRCVFLSSGSEAVEFGVQVARILAPRPLSLSFSGAYLSAYGSTGEQSPSEWHRLDISECRRCDRPETCDPECERLNEIPFGRIGVFAFDGGNMHGTVRLPPRGLVRRIAHRVRTNEGLLVANEITTGMGRTGEWFGYEHYGLRPDVVALGKGLGNGYPVSAVALRTRVSDRLEASAFRYVQSHQNDPLACAVASEVIAVLRDEGLVERSRYLGAKLLEQLRHVAASNNAVFDVRGRGLMTVLELQPTGASATAAHQALLDRGLLVGVHGEANLLRFYPPLTIGEDHIQKLIDGLSDTLSQVREPRRKSFQQSCTRSATDPIEKRNRRTQATVGRAPPVDDVDCVS